MGLGVALYLAGLARLHYGIQSLAGRPVSILPVPRACGISALHVVSGSGSRRYLLAERPSPWMALGEIVKLSGNCTAHFVGAM